MIHIQSRQAARSALDALGLAKSPTPALLQNACAAFAQMVADMTEQRVTVWIGETPIAREKYGLRADSSRSMG
jgi:hypothetical protein